MYKKIFKYFFFLIFLYSFLPSFVFAEVKITEIMYNPSTFDSGKEWIEITNFGEEPVDLTGWKLSRDYSLYDLNFVSGNIVLPKNGHAIISQNPSLFLSDYPDYNGTLFSSNFSLPDSKANVSILDNAEKVVDSVDYYEEWGASFTDESLEYDNNLGGWIADMPTPGQDYSYSGSEIPYLYVGKNTTFIKISNPHLIKANLIFYGDLNIEAGSLVKFKKGTSVYISSGKSLNIQGSLNEPVVLTSNETNPAKSDYKGIFLNNGAFANIKFAEFNYADRAIDSNAEKIYLDNVKFKNNKIGVSIQNGRGAEIKNSIFEMNDFGVWHRPGVFQVKNILHKVFTSLFKVANAEDLNSKIVINNNLFKDNFSYGVFNEDLREQFFIDARNNYWSSALGPKHYTNLLGDGDKVSDNVIFLPFLVKEPLFETPCVDDCYSSILFIPGLEASRLYKPGLLTTEDTLWEPNNHKDVEELFLDSNGNSLRDDIYTKDVIDEIFGSLGNVYKTFMGELKKWKNDEKIIADYALVPYDWRLTLDQILSYGNNVEGKIYYSGNLKATSTPFIIQELKRLSETSKNGKVSIVAHSNGGLVAKALLKKLADNNDPLLEKIDKLFLVAVPQVGTPEAIGALLHGFEQAHFPVIDGEHARTLGKNMPGAYQLLPSDSYWSGLGGVIKNSPIIFNATDFDPIVKAVNKYGLFVNTKEKLWDFLKGAEVRVDAVSDDLSSPSVLNSNLLSYAENIHSQIDNWVPPANITVHQIAGWGEETLGSIIYSTKNECEELVSVGESFYCNKYKKVWTYDPDMVIDGDGTVVTPSALAMSTSSPNVKRWWVDLRSYNDSIFNLERKHKDILEVPYLLNFIKNKDINNDLIPDFIFENQPSYPVDGKRLKFFLHSPLDLTVTDINGKKISSTTSEIPNARYFRMGEIQYISVPGESRPTVNLFGNGKGSFDLKVEEKDGLNTISTTTFSSIPSGEKTLATISFQNGEIKDAEPLKVDYKGDGKYDLELAPKIDGVVTSPVLDVTPPEVQIIFSTSTNKFKIDPFDEGPSKVSSSILNNYSIFKDETGNSLRVSFSELNNVKNNDFRFEIKALLYATSSISSPIFNPLGFYQVTKIFKQDKTLSSIIYRLTTSKDVVFATYDVVKKETRLTSFFKKDLNFNPINNAIIPTTGITNKIIKGLVVPYLETQKGKIIIKY